MQFAHPAALWLLLLVPALLLVRRRQPAETREVGTLRFWREAAPHDDTRPSRRPRITRRVLLQATFLTCVATALASPTLSMPARLVAIVVDVSLSMSARDGGMQRLDTAKDGVRAILADLPWGTRVRVIAAGASPVVAADGPASDASDALTALRPSAGRADLDAALDLARLDDQPPALTYVFSDSIAPDGRDPDVVWTAVGVPADNVAITSLDSRRSRHAGQTDVVLEVANFGSRRAETEVRLEQRGTVVWRTSLSIAAGQRATAAPRLAVDGGTLTARLMAPDALPLDNVRYLGVEHGRPLRVRIVGRNPYVERAISAHPDVQVVETAPHDVTICLTCSEAPDGNDGLIIVPATPRAASLAAPVVMTADALPPARAIEGLLVTPTAGVLRDDGLVLARAGGQPVLVVTEIQGRRIAELRAALDDSELPFTPGFPVLLAAILEWVSPLADNRTAVDAGQPLQWRVPGARTATIVDPDGRISEARITGGRLSLDLPAPGPYRVSIDGIERRFVVNPAADAESNLSQSGPPGIASTTGGGLPDRDSRTNIAPLLLTMALAALTWEWRLRGASRGGTARARA